MKKTNGARPPTLAEARRALMAAANPADAAFLQRFFKTGPGDYGEGDRFLGLRVPTTRRLARRFRDLPLSATRSLLQSPWHEARLLALLLLVERYRRGNPAEREAVHRLYLANTHRVNNWDLVDLSAEHLVGAHLNPADLSLLARLARSDSLWERRIAMLATFYWIKRGEFRPAFHVANLLRNDPHDLIHKAVGWMLREIGKRDRAREEIFLRRYGRTLPRTLLRYAIEHFPEPLRKKYLHGEVCA
ncbi:MAG: DNA alkylation repair protein [Kiritimatiellia bacterium]|nr:DNA alkylation repair protein [Kiritimatiellia bacterium]